MRGAEARGEEASQRRRSPRRGRRPIKVFCHFGSSPASHTASVFIFSGSLIMAAEEQALRMFHSLRDLPSGPQRPPPRGPRMSTAMAPAQTADIPPIGSYFAAKDSDDESKLEKDSIVLPTAEGAGSGTELLQLLSNGQNAMKKAMEKKKKESEEEEKEGQEEEGAEVSCCVAESSSTEPAMLAM